jgi:hypothetical protein
MPTVKTLDERIDGLEETVRDEFTTLKVSFQDEIHRWELRLVERMQDLNTQLVAQIENGRKESMAVIQELAKEFRTEISAVRDASTHATNELKVQLGEFRGRTDNGLALAKWLGTFGATVSLSLMIYIFTVARSSGQLDQKIEALREQSERHNNRIDKLLEPLGK